MHAENLIEMYDSFDFHEKRTRSEWRDKLFNNGIVDWGKRQGIWRSISADKKIQMVGTATKKEFQEKLIFWRPMLLQQALVMMLGAIDKILHQATTTNRFAQLLKTGKLDELMKNFPVSETYNIAIESQIRRGHGGKVRRRPAHKIREVVSAKLYEQSFLKTTNLEKICAVNGAVKIFAAYATHLRKDPELLKKQWSSIYRKRNNVVHECNIIRTKISPKKIRFENINLPELRRDIIFAREFGKFIATKLS